MSWTQILNSAVSCAAAVIWLQGARSAYRIHEDKTAALCGISFVVATWYTLLYLVLGIGIFEPPDGPFRQAFFRFTFLPLMLVPTLTFLRTKRLMDELAQPFKER